MSRYYSLTPDYVENMPAPLAQEYWLAIDMLEAQEMLLKLKVSDYPNLKQQDRSRLHESLVTQAYFESPKKPMTTKEAFAYIQKELG